MDTDGTMERCPLDALLLGSFESEAERISAEWACLITCSAWKASVHDMVSVCKTGTLWATLLSNPFSQTRVPVWDPTAAGASNREVIVTSTDVLLHTCRLNICSMDVLCTYLAQGSFPSYASISDVLLATLMYIQFHKVEGLLMRDLVPLVLRLVSCELQSGAGQYTELRYTYAEQILTPLLRGPHFHLVVHAPNLYDTLEVLAGNMSGFVNLLMTVAGSAILVDLEDLRTNETVPGAPDWWSITHHLICHHTDVTYRTWPRFVTTVHSAHREHFPSKVTRRLLRQCLSVKKYAGRLRSHAALVECPILMDLTTDPVRASDGFVYDRDSLLTYFSKGASRSPLTRERVSTIVHAA